MGLEFISCPSLRKCRDLGSHLRFLPPQPEGTLEKAPGQEQSLSSGLWEQPLARKPRSGERELG